MPLDARRFAILLAWSIACSAGAAETDTATADDLRTAASWSATAARVTRGWLAASLPERYARRTLDVAVDELLRIERTIGRRGDRPAAAAVVERIATVRRAAEAVARRDAAVVAPVVAELDRQSGTPPAAR